MNTPSPTARLSPGTLAAFYLPAPVPPPWTGTSIQFRHLPDGTVAATSRGRVAVGASEADALRRLDVLLRATSAGWVLLEPAPPRHD